MPPIPPPRPNPALIATLLAAALLLLRLLPPWRLAIYPACPVWQYLHLLCPGCGATHALAHLLRGNLHAAWHSNALATLLLPPAILYVALACTRRARGSATPWPPLPRPLTWSLAAAALAFTLARNLAA